MFRNIICIFLLAVILSLFAAPAAEAKSRLERYFHKMDPAALNPQAEAFGQVAQDPPHVPLLRGGETVGYAIVTTDYVSAVGYSGKPIHVAAGLDLEGGITGTMLVKHSEPIVLIGIPEKRITAFMEGYVGENAIARVGKARDAGEVDMISGATVTVMVIEDAIFRAAIKFARIIGLAGLTPEAEAAPTTRRTVREQPVEIADWETLLGDGSVRRRLVTVGEINEAFDGLNNPKASARPEAGNPGDVYIDLYVAPVSVPTIGRSLLGDAEYAHMLETLEEGQQAVLIFANGLYSFKGSGYVRGGVFDRIQLIQGDASTRFRDKFHKRLADIQAEGAPRFTEVGLFRIPVENGFDVTQPFRLELLANRAVGPIKKVFLALDLGYRLPDRYVHVEQLAPPPSQAVEAEPAPLQLWQRMWQFKAVDAVILSLGLGVLTLIFFFQDWLVKRPRMLAWVRNGFLVFTVFWLGFYAQAQLSVVNVLTFFNALLSDFKWDYFLMEPMVFILWFSVAAALLFWGRGAYCGWLCPFGALQELLNKLAKRLKVPQIRVPWGLHERLWPVKYMIFLGLFGLSLYSLAEAELWAEVEPFKTAIILKFIREWPFVVFAVGLLAVGLFIERFYCRYLCPLGAALAIPARLRMFDWLKRYRDCGNPCQRCAHECMVQAIHPEGHINPNECLSCLHCQELYCDDQRCPVVIAKRLKRERRQARSGKKPAT